MIFPLALDGWNGDPVSFWGMREPVSALTHFAGALISLAGALMLWTRCRGDRPKQVSMLVYAGSLVLLYVASSLYHVVHASPAALANFRRADHAAIFLLIAGTFTAYYFNAVRGWWRLGNLLLIWMCAVLGIGVKLVYIEMADGPSAGIYIGMGWSAVIGVPKLATALTVRAMAWTAVGGALYTAGAAADVFEWPVLAPGYFGFHETFHVFVMLASTVHFFVVLKYIVPVERPGSGAESR